MDWRAAGRLIPGLAVVLFGVALYDGYHLLRASQLNRGLVKIEAGAAVDLDHPSLQFARAYALQHQGEFDDAVDAYATIDVREGGRLQADIKYNLANLYLRRALQLREDEADDLALPLIELAKQNYRELLRADNQDWAAKYNLELALQIAPDVDLEEVEEERNPEHNPRAAAGIQVREPLP